MLATFCRVLAHADGVHLEADTFEHSVNENAMTLKRKVGPSTASCALCRMFATLKKRCMDSRSNNVMHAACLNARASCRVLALGDGVHLDACEIGLQVFGSVARCHESLHRPPCRDVPGNRIACAACSLCRMKRCMDGCSNVMSCIWSSPSALA